MALPPLSRIVKNLFLLLVIIAGIKIIINVQLGNDKQIRVPVVPPQSLHEAISRRVQPNGTVVLALVDEAFIDLAMNFYESSLKRWKIENYLFVGASRNSCKEFDQMDVSCFTYTDNVNGDRASLYNTKEFNQKMEIRTDMIIEAMDAGYTVIHTDVDVVFLKNPTYELENTTGDIATMRDGKSFNAGFLIVRPTLNGKWIYKRMKEIESTTLETDDQYALNRALNECLKSKNNISGDCQATTLAFEKYLCGFNYFEKGKRMFVGDNPCKNCVVVHNNWIVSREAKVYRFKETGLWWYDKNQYYSSHHTYLITYGNEMKFLNETDAFRKQKIALRNALYLGNLLNRSVILPHFHCEHNMHTIGHCPMNSLYNIRYFDSQFAGRYRENSFLKHPLVPDHVKKSVFTVPKKFERSKTGTLLNYLKSQSAHVIKFGTIFNVKLDIDSDFKVKVSKGFISAKYRQIQH